MYMKKAVLFIPLLSLIVFPGIGNSDPKNALAEAARSRIGMTVLYDPAYRLLGYPNGDVPNDRGVCTDVVIRAMRSAYHFDLQKHVHEDMKMNFSRYPRNWGLRHPDKNIDHRRVPNLQTFFERQGWSLDISEKMEDYQPGDIVTCMVPPQLPHIMIVSERKDTRGANFIIHNIGAGVQEENRLFEFKITGHYRIKCNDGCLRCEH
jgi:uncharacterized protein YijF (DUF1287 family)